MDFPDFPEQQENTVQFHTIEIDFNLPSSNTFVNWIKNTIAIENHQLTSLNFIFCNDAYLHKINIEFLNHDTLTDIITFPYHALTDPIESDIYISIDRIQENAATFNIPFLTELKRVMIHGVLHLCGYGDKTEQEKRLMRTKEDFYLTKYKG